MATIAQARLLLAMKVLKKSIRKDGIGHGDMIRFAKGSLSTSNFVMHSQACVTELANISDKPFLVDFVLLEKFVGRFKGVDIDISLNGDQFKMSSGKRNFSIKAVVDVDTVNDFVNIPNPSNLLGRLSQYNIVDISRALTMVSNDELRPVLTGVFFGGKSNDLVATNAHKLFFKYDWADAFREDTIVRAPIVSSLVSFCKKSEATTVTWADGTGGGFQWEQDEIVFCVHGSFVDGKYPNYDAVIPKDNTQSIMVSKKELLLTLDDALASANKTTHQVVMKVEKGNIEISSEDLDFGTKFSGTVSADTKRAEEKYAMGFNGKYLSDTVKESESDGDTVLIEMSRPNRAAIVNGQVLIMPIMLND
jgi:DNA polymerase III sliding clamp (beta) subunit (PCNA family)